MSAPTIRQDSSAANVRTQHVPEVIAVAVPTLSKPTSEREVVDLLLWPFAWAWRFAIGLLLCTNYLSSIFVVGWLYRWQQGLVLRGWWLSSGWRQQSSFASYCAALGHDAPTTRPRWFWQQRALQALSRPAANGSPVHPLRQALRVVRWPWQSLWHNLHTGLLALFCTYLLTGWGCLLMTTSWEFGWLNSFHKGYEVAAAGPVLGFAGIFLFIAAMFYVPMAQVHQAVTGDPRAFFQFRFVWALIQAKPASYVTLAAGMLLASLPLELLKMVPYYFEQFGVERAEMTDAEVLQRFNRYRFFAAGWLFGTLLVMSYLSAWIYRSAVLKVLSEGWVSRTELHPTLRYWLQHLEIMPTPPEQPAPSSAGMGSGIWWALGMLNLAFALIALGAFFANIVAVLVVVVVWGFLWLMGGAIYLAISRRFQHYLRVKVWVFSFTLLALIWFLFIAKRYVGEFLHYHPVAGFMNHPLVQLPCLDAVPTSLHEGE